MCSCDLIFVVFKTESKRISCLSDEEYIYNKHYIYLYNAIKHVAVGEYFTPLAPEFCFPKNIEMLPKNPFCKIKSLKKR